MTLTLTLTDPHDAFERFCAPVFCDIIRNYFAPKLGHIVTSFTFLFPHILTMMLLSIMLYTYWTPLATGH